MVLTQRLQRPRKIFSWRDRRDWAVLIVVATAAPVAGLYYLFSAGGAAAADAAISGKIDSSRLTALNDLEPEKSEARGTITIL